MGTRNLKFDLRKRTMKERSSVTVTPDFIHPCACQQVASSYTWLLQMYIACTV